MNVTVAALLGLAMAQPPGTDYYPLNARNITLPIEYKQARSSIRQVQLWYCENGDQVWKLGSSAPPTQDSFTYVAPADGLYWFHIVIVDLKGGRDPANLTAEAPAMKVLVDTSRPLVTFTNVKRTGEEVVVEWKTEDKFPSEAATRAYLRAAGAGAEDWREVTLPAGSKTGVRFPTGTTGPVTFKVVVADLAGNTGEGQKEISAAGATSTSLSPGSPAAVPPSTPAVALPVVPAPEAVAPIGPGPVAPAAPAAPPPAPTGVPVSPPAPLAVAPVVTPTAPATVAPTVAPLPTATPLPTTSAPAVAVAPAAPAGPQAVPTFDPRSPVLPAAGAGSPPPAAPFARPPAGSPVVEMTRAQVINTLRFDLNYNVEQRGPSGIARVDLWVTRDDGKTWVWWSQHNGQEAAVKVNLATQSNAQPEGTYGFRLAPVSGAGLSEATPAAGDAPDIRVVVDVTAPVVKVFAPTSDPATPDALVIQWEASDRNFGDDPIVLEWSESPTGPWRPVAAAGGDGVVQVGAGTGAATRRLPNTGWYAWRVPAGLPPRVYLKVAARDAAGNTTEQVTREPILIDLTKPRAKITGLGTAPVVRP